MKKKTLFISELIKIAEVSFAEFGDDKEASCRHFFVALTGYVRWANPNLSDDLAKAMGFTHLVSAPDAPTN